ncbi:LicD family protein [Thermodesulfobacteriota bacterium]
MAGDQTLTGKYLIDAKNLLKKVCRILDKNNIPYVLEGGTLLGIVRENRLLPWDNDLDITITEDQMSNVLKIKWELTLSGCRVKIRKSIKEVPYFSVGSIRMIKIKPRKFLFFPGRVHLDIFVKKRVEDQYYWTVDERNPVLKAAPAHFYENFDRINFDGYEYSVPKDYKEYLTYRYGDWTQTVKNYSFRKDDNAIINREEPL